MPHAGRCWTLYTAAMASYTIIVLVIVCAIAVAVIAVAPARGREAPRRRHGRVTATGLPSGEIVYSDAGGTARPLAARRYPLVGKPDYVVLTPEGLRVPVEIKSARAPRPLRGESMPRHEDVLQVVAYLIILDDLFTPPRYGLLRYADATFEVPYAPELRAEVLDLLDEMRALDGDGQPPRGDPAAAKCRSCAFRAICDDAAV